MDDCQSFSSEPYGTKGYRDREIFLVSFAKASCIAAKDIFLLNFCIIGNLYRSALTNLKASEMALAIFPDSVANSSRQLRELSKVLHHDKENHQSWCHFPPHWTSMSSGTFALSAIAAFHFFSTSILPLSGIRVIVRHSNMNFCVNYCCKLSLLFALKSRNRLSSSRHNAISCESSVQ